MEAPYDLSEFRYRNILVVDDEPAMHQMFTCCLQPGAAEEEPSYSHDGEVLVDTPKVINDFNVYSALSGEEGLSLCKAQSKGNSPIQLAFVDMRMKGWDGIETIQHMMDNDPRMSFVIITGFPDDTREKAGQRLGAAPIQIFGKPVKLEELYNTAYAMTKRWNRLHGDN